MMNVSELYSLTEWVQREVVDKHILEKYEQLQPLNPPFESQKEELLSTLRAIHTTSLSNDQVTFLSKLGIDQLIGKAGADAIEDILWKNGLDAETAAQKIAERAQTLNEGISKVTQIAEGLSGLVKSEKDDVTDGVIMRVSFLGDASMNNVSDFKKWGEIWYNIGRGVAQAHGRAPENITVVGAAKGSIVIELLAGTAIAATVGRIIFGALQITERVYELRKKSLEIRVLLLQGKKIFGEIEKDAEKQKSAAISTILKELIKLLKLKLDSDGDKIIALEKSIIDLVNFTNKGGGVDFVVPEKENNDDDKAVDDRFVQIREQAEKNRRLENKLKLIEYKNGEKKKNDRP